MKKVKKETGIRVKLIVMILFLIITFFLFKDIKNQEDIELYQTLKIYDFNDEVVVTSSIDETGESVTKTDEVYRESLAVEIVDYGQKDISAEMEKVQEVVDGYIVTIDEEKFYISDIQDLQLAIDKIYSIILTPIQYQQYLEFGEVPTFIVNGKKITDIEADNEIEIVKGKVPADSVMTSAEEIYYYLLSGGKEKEMVTIEDGGSVEQIMKDYKLNELQFKLNNPGITENTILAKDSTINVTAYDPVVDIAVYYEEKVREPLEFKVEYVEDETLRLGEEEVANQGKDGVQDVVYRTKMVNGEEVSSVPIDTEIVKKPVNQVVYEGSKVIDGYGTEQWVWPASGTQITNTVGGFSALGNAGGHAGTDIVSWYGAPVYAVDNGIVTFAGYNPYGGGNEVRIDHQNGYTSVYSHLAETPLVSEGQIVEGGQVIGYEGQSGVAYGTHLHFELRYNGTPVDPIGIIPH